MSSFKKCISLSLACSTQCKASKKRILMKAMELCCFFCRYGAANCRGISKEVGETSELQSHEALSSTLAVQQVRKTAFAEKTDHRCAENNLSCSGISGGLKGANAGFYLEGGGRKESHGT